MPFPSSKALFSLYRNPLKLPKLRLLRRKFFRVLVSCSAVIDIDGFDLIQLLSSLFLFFVRCCFVCLRAELQRHARRSTGRRDRFQQLRSSGGRISHLCYSLLRMALLEVSVSARGVRVPVALQYTHKQLDDGPVRAFHRISQELNEWSTQVLAIDPLLLEGKSEAEIKSSVGSMSATPEFVNHPLGVLDSPQTFATIQVSPPAQANGPGRGFKVACVLPETVEIEDLPCQVSSDDVKATCATILEAIDAAASADDWNAFYDKQMSALYRSLVSLEQFKERMKTVTALWKKKQGTSHGGTVHSTAFPAPFLIGMMFADSEGTIGGINIVLAATVVHEEGAWKLLNLRLNADPKLVDSVLGQKSATTSGCACVLL